MEDVYFINIFLFFALIQLSETLVLDRRPGHLNICDEDQPTAPVDVYLEKLNYEFSSEFSISERSRVAKELSVSNGGPWGDWGTVSFCADGSYAVGYDMKIEPPHSLDNTSLNGIRLICGFMDGEFAGEAESADAPWGQWVGKSKCNMYKGKPMFLTSFDLQVEQPGGDDTAANYVKFKCQDLCREHNAVELVKPPGHGLRGRWGPWSDMCPRGTAICGIKTKVEKPQLDGDDTALNDAKFYCCF